jgi:hypothetical protein
MGGDRFLRRHEAQILLTPAWLDDRLSSVLDRILSSTLDILSIRTASRLA